MTITATSPLGSTDAESKLRLAPEADCAAADKMLTTATMPAVTVTIIAAHAILNTKFFLIC